MENIINKLSEKIKVGEINSLNYIEREDLYEVIMDKVKINVGGVTEVTISTKRWERNIDSMSYRWFSTEGNTLKIWTSKDGWLDSDTDVHKKIADLLSKLIAPKDKNKSIKEGFLED